MSKKTDALMADVVTDLVTRMEEGAGTWTMPWRTIASAGMPVSIAGRPYRGVNTWLLGMAAMDHGYEAGTWGTYNAWKTAGCQVRKGEHGEAVFLWKPFAKEDKETGETRSGLFCTTFTVFAAEQVDGYEAPVLPEGPAAIESVEAFFKAVPSKVTHGGNRAYYTPAADKIAMPARKAFKDSEAYYSTLAHEHVHWTGHESRLDRSKFTDPFGSDGYAMEELVAELGSALFGAAHGIGTADTAADNAAYLASWCKRLRESPKVLVSVSSKAQAAVDHLEGYQAKELLDSAETVEA